MNQYKDFAWTSPQELAALSEGNEPWEFYLSTKVEFFEDSSLGTVMPSTDGQDSPPFGSLHIVTAIQPNEEPTDMQVARMRVLDQEIGYRGIRSLRAVGSALDGTHSEESRALWGLTDYEARELGLRFGQVAVFAWRGRDWSVLACATDKRTDQRWTWR